MTVVPSQGTLRSFGFRALLVLGFPLVVGTAAAAAWSPYESAFPAFPCADAWAACKSGGGARGPGMTKDNAGHPMPAHARIGWFDLAPTAAFSPFTGLSGYDGAIGGQVAVAPPPEPTPQAGTPTPAPDAAPAPEAGTDAAPPQPTAQVATTDAGSPERILPSTPPPTATPPAGTSSPTPTPVAQTAPASTARTTPTATTPTATTPTPTPTADASVKAVQPTASAGDDCSDIVKLEPVAMMGTLSVGQAKCVEGRIASEGRQTERDKLSRVLINNAEAKGDKADWERLVKRHLEDIDRSDPDLCYKYALQLSRGGAGRAQGVIRWADYALENKARWSGNTYKSRVYALLKLKTEAANKVWQDAENEYMTKEHTEANEAKAAKWRGTTKDFAREWLDYAKSSGQDTKNAMSICVSASGSQSFCGG